LLIQNERRLLKGSLVGVEDSKSEEKEEEEKYGGKLTK